MTKIISRTVVVLSLVSLFTDMASEMLYPVMPAYMKSIGFSFLVIGLLEGVAEFIAGYSKGYFGNLSDHYGRRMPFVISGYALSTLSKGLLAVCSTVMAVFSARLLDRAGKGIRTSARDALLSDESTAKTKARVFGFHRSMDTAGAVLGPTAAILWLNFHPGDYHSLFILAFLPGVIAVLICFLVRETKKQPDPGRRKPGFFSFLNYWHKASQNFRWMVVPLVLFALVNSSDVFLLLAVKAKGFSDHEMILLYLFYNVVYALMAFPAGWLADKIGIPIMISAALIFFFVVYYFFPVSHTLNILALLFFVYGLFAACFESTAKALLSLYCQKEEAGTALGFYNSLSSMAAVFAGAWTGWLWNNGNATHAFGISASGAAVAAAAIFILDRFLRNQPLRGTHP